MIKVYPSRLEGEPLEVHRTSEAMTFRSWVKKNAPLCDLEKPKFSLYINSEPAGLDQTFFPEDAVKVVVNPEGVGVVVAAAVSVAVSLLATYLLNPATKKAKEAKGLEAGAVENNLARLNEPIPEIFGRPPRIYPDYLVPPRKFWLNREQWLDAFFCIGKGSFEKSVDGVFIGETRLKSLDGAQVVFYEPNQFTDTSVPADVWHSPKEVGFTNQAGSGLELKSHASLGNRTAGIINIEQVSVVSSDAQSGVVRLHGGGEWPADWVAGVVLDITKTASIGISVQNGVNVFRTLDARVLDMNLTAGDKIKSRGDLEGSFTVASVAYANDGVYFSLKDVNSNFVSSIAEGLAQIAFSKTSFLYEIAERISDIDVILKNNDISGGLDKSLISLSSDFEKKAWVGPFQIVPAGEQADKFEIDFEFPRGFTKVDDDVDFLISYKLADKVDSPWIYENLKLYDGVSLPWDIKDAFGYTKTVDLSFFSKKIYVRVLLGYSHDSRPVLWTNVRAKLDSKPNFYKDVTTMAVRVKLTSSLASAVENKIWLKATRKLEFLNEPLAPTRDICPAFLYVMKSCGYEEFIDEVALQEVHSVLKAREDYFDFIASSHSTVKKISNDILKVGFSELTIDEGLLTVVRDSQKTTPNYIYSAHEMVEAPVVTVDLPKFDDIDGVDVEYLDEETNKIETIKVRLNGENTERRVEKIEVLGVTNPQKAYKIGARYRRTLAFRRKFYKIKTELQALNSSYLSFDMIQDFYSDFQQSVYFSHREDGKFVVTEPLNFSVGGQFVVAFKNRDGTATKSIEIARGDNDYEFICLYEEPLMDMIGLNTAGIEPTVIYFGSKNEVAHKVLVSRISPNSDGTVDLEAFGYDDRIYANDDN